MAELEQLGAMADTSLSSPINSPTPSRPSDTVLIFDWDDTLLCTAAVNRGAWDEPTLRHLEKVVEVTLRVAMSLGETLIVTNGNGTWVEDSAKAYLPGLLPILSELKVISARAHYEFEHPGNPFAWKRRAFRELCAPSDSEDGSPRGRFGGYRSTDMNLIVFGDSVYEMDAATGLKGTLSASSLIKTVKFAEQPSSHELIGQLLRVTQDMTAIVDSGFCESINLLQQGTEHSSAEARAWSLVDREEFLHNESLNPQFGERPSTDILPPGILDWVFRLGDQLLCKEPGSWLSQYEDAYEASQGKDSKEAKNVKYYTSDSSMTSPWQH